MRGVLGFTGTHIARRGLNPATGFLTALRSKMAQPLGASLLSLRLCQCPKSRALVKGVKGGDGSAFSHPCRTFFGVPVGAALYAPGSPARPQGEGVRFARPIARFPSSVTPGTAASVAPLHPAAWLAEEGQAAPTGTPKNLTPPERKSDAKNNRHRAGVFHPCTPESSPTGSLPDCRRSKPRARRAHAIDRSRPRPTARCCLSRLASRV